MFSMPSSAVKQRCLQFFRGVILLSLTLLIFLNPFPHVSTLTNIFFYTALYTALAFALLLLCSQTPRPDLRSPLGLPILFFLLWALAGTIWTSDWQNNLQYVNRYLSRSLFIYFMLISFFSRKEHFLALIWTFILSITLFSLGALIYVYFLSANPISFRLYLKGIHTNPIAQCCMFGTLLALCYFPMARKWPEKAALMICSLSTFSAVLLTYSRGALLALATGCFSLIFTSKFKKPLIITSLIILAASIVIFNISPDQQNRLSFDFIRNDERIKIYATAYEMLKEKPLAGFGYGAEAFEKNFSKFNKRLPQEFMTQIEYPHPHNIFLDIAIRLGLVGLALFCWILLRVFKMGRELMVKGKDPFLRQWGTAITACLIAFLTVGLFGDLLSRRNSMILYAIMAMITILWKLHRSDEESLPEHGEIRCPPNSGQGNKVQGA